MQSQPVPAGSKIKVKLLDELRSDKAQVGDRVRVEVVGSEKNSLPAGRVLVGRVTAVRPASRKEAGHIDLQFGTLEQSGDGPERAPGRSAPENPLRSTSLGSAAPVALGSAHLVGKKPRSFRPLRIGTRMGSGRCCDTRTAAGGKTH